MLLMYIRVDRVLGESKVKVFSDSLKHNPYSKVVSFRGGNLRFQESFAHEIIHEI